MAPAETERPGLGKTALDSTRLRTISISTSSDTSDGQDSKKITETPRLSRLLTTRHATCAILLQVRFRRCTKYSVSGTRGLVRDTINYSSANFNRKSYPSTYIAIIY